MRRLARLALVVLLAGIAAPACEPTTVIEPAPGQILLYVDTDAIVPTGRMLGPLDPTPLFDRLRIDVLRPGEDAPCDECTNELSIDEGVFQRRAASVGIAPPPGATGYRARVRLFYGALRSTLGAPDPDATIERVVALPAVPEHGKVSATVVLLTDEVGAPVGTIDEPADTIPGAPSTSLVGTWAPARRGECSKPAPRGMVCVPSGAYWMGDRRKVYSVLDDSDVNAPRLVALGAFYLDAHEVTVAEFRADPLAKADIVRDDANGSENSDFCNFTAKAGGREDRPANCVSWIEARKYCQRRGGDLPTEAQYEYVASGTRNHSFVWGDDPPACEDAVYSRVGWGIFVDSLATCRPPRPFGGSEPAGRGARDRLDLPSGALLDLAGNVSEWQRDLWNGANEPCWSRPGVYSDPLCATPAKKGTKERVIRGGAWSRTAGQLDRTGRMSAPETTTLLDTGIRCIASGD